MNLIDTHAHLQFKNYEEDREKIFRQCHDENVGMILVGCDYKSSKDGVALAEEYKDQNVWASVGQHPTDTAVLFIKNDFDALIKSSSQVIGIGECGLDYFHLPALAEDEIRQTGGLPTVEMLKKKQKELFKEHLILAHESRLPLIIHCRDAHDDMIQLLVDHFARGGKESLLQDREHGVMHCFTSTLAYAQSYLDLGFLISFTGIITFAAQYDDVVRMTPLDKILIETDSPFLTPIPFRGKKNTPLNVKYVAQGIAQIKGISFDEVAAATTKNAKRLFRMP